MTHRDDFSRRPTAPSVQAQHPGERPAVRDPKETIKPGLDKPGSDSARVFARPAMTLADLDERHAMRMVDMLATLRDDNAKRDKRTDEKIAKAIGDLRTELAPFAAATDLSIDKVSIASPPLQSPGNPGDLLIPARPKVPSMTGDPQVDAARIAALEDENREDSLRYRSLAETITGMQTQLAKVESAVKAQPGAATKAAEVVAAKTAETSSSLERVLTNKTFWQSLITVITLLLGLFVHGAVTSSKIEQGAEKAATSAEHGAEKGTKEAAAESRPQVVIVRDKEPTP